MPRANQQRLRTFVHCTQQQAGTQGVFDALQPSAPYARGFSQRLQKERGGRGCCLGACPIRYSAGTEGLEIRGRVG